MNLMTLATEDLTEEKLALCTMDDLFEMVSTEGIDIAVEKISLPLFGKVSEFFTGRATKLASAVSKEKPFKKLDIKKIEKSLNKVVFVKYSSNNMIVPENFQGRLSVYSSDINGVLEGSRREVLEGLDDHVANISYIITNNSLDQLRVFEAKSIKAEKLVNGHQKRLGKYFPKNTGVTLATIRSVFDNKDDIMSFMSNINAGMGLSDKAFVAQVVEKTNKLGTVVDLLRSSIAAKETTVFSIAEIKKLARTIQQQAEYVEWISSLVFDHRAVNTTALNLAAKIRKDFK